jgi:hypothetical protein
LQATERQPRLMNGIFKKNIKNLPAGVPLEPAIPEMEQVMRWIGLMN